MARYVILIALLFFSIISFSQEKNGQFVFSSPVGNYILLDLESSDISISLKENIKIERSRKGQNNFSVTGSFSSVKSYDEFVKLTGAETAAEFKNYIKAKTNEEVIAFLKNHANVKDFGFYILDVNLLRAAGLIYLDEMPRQNTAEYEYRLTVDGKLIKQQASLPFNKNDLPRGTVSHLFTTDSLVRISWSFQKQEMKIPLFARIYRQNNPRGLFIQLPKITTINNSEDKLTVFFEETAQPEQFASYYCVPIDLFGNEGLPSDTISAIAVDFKKIPGIQNVTIVDTLDGLLSEWTQLPQKPYYTGIQILRSRDATKDFIVLDSLPITATSYLDKRVLPNITYYYKFRPLVYKLSGWDEIIAATFFGTKGATKHPPLPPKNLEVMNEERNIRLTWDHNQELDIFAYYVQRGTSAQNMEIVSPAIKDTTWLDSTANLSGRTNYVYSVIAMNNNQLKSNISNTAGIKPDRGEFVEPPAGITIRAEGRKFLIKWSDVSKKDIATAGYILYRRKSKEKEFAPVIKQLIMNPYYEDADIESNTEYVYTVSSVDRFGYESQKSPEAVFILSEPALPPSLIYLRQLTTGVEISWPNNENKGIASFNIYRRLPEENKYIKLGSAKPEDGKFIDKKFIKGKLHIYAVTVTNNHGESDKSIEKALFIE